MNLLLQSWDFRALWMMLPLQTKLFFLCLISAASYITYALVAIYTRIRSVPDKDSELVAKTIYSHFSRRIRNLRQLHYMFFLLFSLTLTDEIFRALQAYELSKLSFSATKAAEVADPVLGFSFCCFVILTFLHLFQWLVANRIEKVASPAQ